MNDRPSSAHCRRFAPRAAASLAILTCALGGAGLVAAPCRAQDTPPPNELKLPSVEAFALGARVAVRDVEAVDVVAFNAGLAQAHAHGEGWAESFVTIAQRLAQLAPQGREQHVDVAVAPGEWEPGRALPWVRVTVVDRGWLDDTTAGVRLVAWIVPDPEGGLRVHRALRAWECSRPGKAYYSAQPCP